MKIRSLGRGKMSVGIVLALVTVLAGTALALTSVSRILGTVAKYDFGGFGPGYPAPGRIQIQAFTMKPGDTVPWHYHKGVSYVILAHGSLTEQDQIGPRQCETEQVTAGNAFVESAGQVHSVTNTGSNLAVIWWATIFPKSDKIVQFTPEFKSGGVYVVNAPNCS